VVAIVGVTADGKAGIVVGVTPILRRVFSAVDLVRRGAEALGGKAAAGGPIWRSRRTDGAKAGAALAPSKRRSRVKFFTATCAIVPARVIFIAKLRRETLEMAHVHFTSWLRNWCRTDR